MRVAAEWYAKQHIVEKLFPVDTDNLLCDCGVQQPVSIWVTMCIAVNDIIHQL